MRTSFLLSALFLFSACSHASRAPSSANGESVITIIGTNDVHGHFLTESPQADTDEETPGQGGTQALGGQEWFAGYVNAIRAAAHAGDTTLLLDAGDFAQGTLISNSDEGQLAAKIMNQLGYAAAIPGNHAYDFGPIGPQVDQCALGDDRCDPLEALKRFVTDLRFPILAANVTGAPFLKSYALIPYRGRNIAVIGLENAGTPSTTYRLNVKSLQFSAGTAETAALVKQLRDSGKADVFILVAHNGDMAKDSPFFDFLDGLPTNADGSPLLDAAIIGHTHILETGTRKGIPYVQSNWGGKYFGLVQLSVTPDPATGRLIVAHDKTSIQAGIPIVPKESQFLGQSVKADPTIASLLKDASSKVDALSNRKIGVLKTALSDQGKRLADSEIGNFVADVMNAAAGSEISVIGSGDVRMGLTRPADGALRYSDLFNVLPKGLQLVDVAELPVSLLIDNLKLSIQTCGARGALQTSGIKISFQRDCTNPVKGIDPKAKLTRVVTNSGEVLFPATEAKRTTVHLSTTDFVLTGGAGYTKFMPLLSTPDGLRSVRTVGPLRDLMVMKIGAMGTITNAPFQPGRYVNSSE